MTFESRNKDVYYSNEKCSRTIRLAPYKHIDDRLLSRDIPVIRPMSSAFENDAMMEVVLTVRGPSSWPNPSRRVLGFEAKRVDWVMIVSVESWNVGSRNSPCVC